MTTDVKFTEKELLLLLNQQDATAFSYVYDRYAPLIYGLILREVKNDQVASEILKAAFINIFKECKNLDCVKQSLFTWLLSLTRKTASSDFKVDIGLKSLLLSQNTKRENKLQPNNSYTDSHNPVPTFRNLTPTVG